MMFPPQHMTGRPPVLDKVVNIRFGHGNGSKTLNLQRVVYGEILEQIVLSEFKLNGSAAAIHFYLP